MAGTAVPPGGLGEVRRRSGRKPAERKPGRRRGGTSGGGELRRQTSLDDRYGLEAGRVYMTGVQALVRVLVDQHRADAAAGLSTASLVSGYQGSPLAGFDREVAGLGEIGAEQAVVHRPGVNEELGATAVWGSQLAGTLPGPRYDGVVGVWYGKAPGVDRAADAIRHGNFVGTDPRGGVLALCGDDPASKSSTVPSASETLLAAMHVPVLAPGSVQEALDFGRHAIACSRASGLWAALKVVTNVADAAATVTVGHDRVRPVIPELEWEGGTYVHRPSAQLLAPASHEMERTLLGPRIELARRYARANDLNRIYDAAGDSPVRGLGVVASGVTFTALRRALADLGLDGSDRSRPAVRLLRVGMPYPFDAEAARRFAEGLDEILVVEEKAPLLEPALKDALYRAPAAPLVLGKGEAEGPPLFEAHGVLEEDTIARAIAGRALERADLPAVRARLDQLEAVASRPAIELGAARRPFFCSGCPHSTSTAADDDEIVGAGIGCHTMILLSPEGHGDVRGITQMGGEGAQWIGAAPFTETSHFTQNLGDGTFHHSGSLAVRAAVAADLDVTYKLLFNGAVAMTGGQRIEGGLALAAMVRSLQAEGVRRVAITTEDPGRLADLDLPRDVEVRDRRELIRTQRELAELGGVTVLIHDQACATELRRARKRGLAPEPAERVVINERVCEGCGDCGHKSGCLSVEPVMTEFGRKTRIDQTSCNKDFSCLEGDCPAFMTITEPAGAAPRTAAGAPPDELPDPPALPDRAGVRIIGIGGTGVVTVSQVLGMAAMLDGLDVGGLDQTGLSQKAGPVVSDLRLGDGAVGEAPIAAGQADVLLALDMLGATAANLRAAGPGRTTAVVCGEIAPTGTTVTDVRAPRPDPGRARAAIESATEGADNVYIESHRLAERLFGDATPANVVALGAAWQRGLLPVSLDSLEQAFALNGVAVERNLAAFAWGRAAVAAPALIDELFADPAPVAEPDRRVAELAATVPGAEPGTELRRLLEIRIAELIGWGGKRCARRYVETVAGVARRESERLPGSSAVTEAVARGLFKLTAYKDEYEVARLHLQSLAELPSGSRARIHLHPPLLRALGLDRKLRLGRWFVPVLRLLRRGRVLRGTFLDPFGYAAVRRLERRLPGEYMARVDEALERLSAGTLPTAVEVAELPDLVRGYEQIKLDGVERFRARGDELSEELAARG